LIFCFRGVTNERNDTASREGISARAKGSRHNVAVAVYLLRRRGQQSRASPTTEKSGSLLANKWTLKTFELIHKGRCAATRTPLRTTICHFGHCAAMPLSRLRCALCVIGCASGGRHHLASSRHKMKIDSYLSIEPMEPIRQAGAPLHTDSTSHSTVWSGSYAA
jgi:hypothetical protein